MFLSKLRASDDRSPFGEFWFEPISVRTQTGVRVSAESAMRLSAVFACVRVLAETFAVLPFCLNERKAGKASPVLDHPLVRLFRRPNPWQNGFEWREMMMGHIALRGNAYNRVTSGGAGEITRLVPIHPDRVKPELLAGGDYRYRIRQASGQDEILTRDQVWHLRGLSSDGIVGLSPIELARETIGLGISAQEYGSRFFQNDARPGGGWIEHPGTFKEQAARKQFVDTWQSAQTGANRHKTAVLEFGMKYHELGIKNNDAQFLETRKFQVTDIARIFRMPPHLIGDLERSTNNNIEQQSLEFVTFTMTPWAERWEAAIENDLLLDGENLDVEFDFANLLRGDQKARADYYSSGITNGWLTRNEARDKESLNPIEGLDEPLTQRNMQTADQAALPAPAPAVPNSAPPDSGSRPEGRFVALVQASAQRIARREIGVVERAARSKDAGAVATAYQEHAAFVAECLNVPLEVAAEYCAQRLAVFQPGQSCDDFELLARSALERLALKGNAS